VIYQLIKRDYLSWVVVAGLCAAIAVGDWLGYVETILFAILAILLLLNGSGRGRRCTEFAAALPIRGWDFFLARLVSDLTLVWAPLSVILATSPLPSGMTRRDANIFFVEIGAILTLGVFCIQSSHVQQFAPPRWWQTGVVGIVGLAIIYDDEISPRTTLMICVLGSCALLLRILILAPRSMQLAPENPESPKASGTSRWLPGIPWLPVLRALFRPDFVMIFAVLAFTGALGLPFLGAIFAMWSIGGEVWRLRSQNRWLLSEPVARSLLFALIVGARLLSYMAGSFFQPYFRHQPARIAVIDFLIAGYLLLALSVIAELVPGWRHPRWLWLRLLLVATLIATPEIIARLFWSRGIYTRTSPVEKMLNGVLPVGSSLLVAAVGLTLAALAWVVYQLGFRQLDFPQLRSKYR